MFIYFFMLTIQILRECLYRSSCSQIFLSGLFFTNMHNHGTAGKGGGYLFNSSLPLLSVSQILRHQPKDYCRGAYLCTKLAAGLELGTFGFRAQVANH